MPMRMRVKHEHIANAVQCIHRARLLSLASRVCFSHSNSTAAMVVQRVRVHKRGLSSATTLRVVALRKHHFKDKKMSWEKIAEKVVNLEGETPGWKVCRDAFNRAMAGRSKKDKYANCGRNAILDKALRSWIVRRLRSLRKSGECTSVVLQMALAKEKKVTVEASTVRRALKKEGYKWLNRTKKPKYDAKHRQERLKFARKVLSFSVADFKKEMNFSMDGWVCVIPPADPVGRENFCYSDVTKVWRLPSERALPELEGYDGYKNQAPVSRVIPLWGGLGAGGFAPVLWHSERKTNEDEWAAMLESGVFITALRAANKGKTRGPWTVLCDNETFLRAPKCRKAYRRLGIKLWKLPARSPDLNPIEKMWGWARKRLRAMDLGDLKAGRRVLGKTAYKARIKRLFKTQKAQQVAKNLFGNLRTVARRVVRAKGGAVRG